jgi:hypothetical protein
METLLSLLIGFGLAAACGFRVFVPLLVLAVGARTDLGAQVFQLAPGFEWLASDAALIAFAAATLLEIAGYYVPWVDNLLDAVATPAAIVAGVLVAASTLVLDVSPFMRWTLAALAGGGTAATFQGVTATLRQISTFTTGGLANPVLSTGEAAASAVLAVLAVTLPVLAALVVVTLLWVGVRKLLLRSPVRA